MEIDDVIVIDVVVTAATVSEKTPELGSLFASPEYVAVIVTGEVAVGGVYSTAHDPPERSHVIAGENSATLLDAQVMLPVGDAPMTVAVQTVAAPGETGDGVQLIATCDMALDGLRAKLPAVTGLRELPP